MSQVRFKQIEGIDSKDTFLGNLGEYVKFSGKTQNYCIGFVDIVNSTKIAAKIPASSLGMYYSVFLNSMVKIIQKFGGTAVKNMGDSILFYFPNETSDQTLRQVLDCGMEMIESRCSINTKLFKENLPAVNYRISIDYGEVSTAFSSSSLIEDIFGPPVNVCTKINHRAIPNGIVIGSDLYRMIKNHSQFIFRQVSSFSSGLKNEYPIYSVIRSIDN